MYVIAGEEYIFAEKKILFLRIVEFEKKTKSKKIEPAKISSHTK